MPVEIIAALITLLGTLLAAFLIWWLHRRPPPEPSDKEALALWTEAFDRGAFKAPFAWRSARDDWEDFAKAVELTIKALATGVLENRAGQPLPGRGKPRSRLKNKEWAVALDDVSHRLRRIRSLAQNVDVVGDRSELGLQIDKERDTVIETLNSILRQARLPELRLPTSYSSFDEAFPGGREE